jgi:hypothetical protein
VWKHYASNWQGCAHAWAVHGRRALWALAINTNNHLERWFGLLKNTILQRKKLSRLVLLMGVLLGDVMVPSIQKRLMKLSLLDRSGVGNSDVRVTVVLSAMPCVTSQQRLHCVSDMVVATAVAGCARASQTSILLPHCFFRMQLHRQLWTSTAATCSTSRIRGCCA